MTIEIAMYIFGAALLPLLGWGIHITWNVRKMVEVLDKLMDMHEHPDEHGFGTGGIKEVIEENTRAVKALTHYITWLAAQQQLPKPPPPLDE